MRKPVTAGDVARFAGRLITNASDEERIIRAIASNEELRSLFAMLTEDDDEDEGSPPLSTLKPPGFATPEAYWEYIKLLDRSRLCRLDGSVATGGVIWLAKELPVTFRFEPVRDAAGTFTMLSDVPSTHRVLSLVAADFAWGDPTDVTRKAVPEGWSNLPTRSDSGRNGTHGETVPAVGLAAEAGPRAHDVLLERQGEALSLIVVDEPQTARLVIRESGFEKGGVRLPVPIKLTAMGQDGGVIAEVVQVISDHAESLIELFDGAAEAVAWIEVAPLAIDEACRLSPSQAASLIGSTNYAVRAMHRVPDHPQVYTVDLSDNVVIDRMNSKNCVLGLQIVALEEKRQVQR